MATFTKAASVVLLLIHVYIGVTQADPHFKVVYKICNGDQFSVSDELYTEHLGDLLDRLIYETPSNGYDYYQASPGKLDVVYGHAACNGRLAPLECCKCLYQAMLDTISEDCPQLTRGLQIQVVDCRLRYEIYPFTDQ